MTKNTITPEKLRKYFDVTGRALKKVRLAKTARIDVEKSARDFFDMSETQSVSEHAPKPRAVASHKQDCSCRQCRAHVVFDMAQRYFSDARHFEKKGDIVTAFAALNYAHGWLDAGARLGLFDVGHDDKLFTVD
jgi:hypothetical protein